MQSEADEDKHQHADTHLELISLLAGVKHF